MDDQTPAPGVRCVPGPVFLSGLICDLFKCWEMEQSQLCVTFPFSGQLDACFK